jgi:hypothetical protein
MMASVAWDTCTDQTNVYTFFGLHDQRAIGPADGYNKFLLFPSPGRAGRVTSLYRAKTSSKLDCKEYHASFHR